MPPELGARFEVGFAGRPRHMSAIDFELWKRFRLQHTLPFEALRFDVAVGRGAPPTPDVTPEVAAAWQRLTRQRLDVVGESAAGWTIIELRGAAGPGAIGSLVVYRDLWLDDPPDAAPVALWLVTDVLPENLQLTLQKQAIRLFLV